MSAFVKIPLQVLVLMVGVFMFLFYVFNPPPMLFNTEYRDKVEQSARAGDYHALETDFSRAYERRRTAAADLAAADRRPRQAIRAATDDMQAIRGRAAARRQGRHRVRLRRRVGDTPSPMSTTCSRRS
jgi:hypothetical protein